MRNNLLLPLVFASIASLALTASYRIPFNVPGLVVYYYIAQSHPELQKTGPAVEIEFAWVTIRQAWVWWLLSAYHMIFFAPVCLLLGWLRTHRKNTDAR